VQIDKTGLYSIGQELIVLCYLRSNWEQACQILHVCLRKKTLFKGLVANSQFVVQGLESCLNAGNPKLAALLVTGNCSLL